MHYLSDVTRRNVHPGGESEEDPDSPPGYSCLSWIGNACVSPRRATGTAGERGGGVFRALLRLLPYPDKILETYIDVSSWPSHQDVFKQHQSLCFVIEGRMGGVYFHACLVRFRLVG